MGKPDAIWVVNERRATAGAIFAHARLLNDGSRCHHFFGLGSEMTMWYHVSSQRERVTSARIAATARPPWFLMKGTDVTSKINTLRANAQQRNKERPLKRDQ